MAVIHETTVVPDKLELLTAWLPAQPWYRATGQAPELARAGGFRLDDPEGEVGIEFMVVTDSSGGETTAYQVPLTYRASPCAAASEGLIGTAEHGVLGHRWIYDGTRDPVLVAQLVALIQDRTQAQAQNVSNTPDPTVISQPVPGGDLNLTGCAVAADGPDGTDLRIETADASGSGGDGLLLRVHRVLRVLRAGSGTPPGGWRPCVTAIWRLPDGTHMGGTFASAGTGPESHSGRRL